MRYFSLLVIAFYISSCTDEGAGAEPGPVNSQTPHANAVAPAPIGLPARQVDGCYSMAARKDTGNLRLQLNDSTITGTLQFKHFEKENNNGTIKGVLRGDTILCDYTFFSAGSVTVQQVSFLFVGDTLLLAGGSLKNVNKTWVLQNKQAVLYDSTRPFIKTVCRPSE